MSDVRACEICGVETSHTDDAPSPAHVVGRTHVAALSALVLKLRTQVEALRAKPKVSTTPFAAYCFARTKTVLGVPLPLEQFEGAPDLLLGAMMGAEDGLKHIASGGTYPRPSEKLFLAALQMVFNDQTGPRATFSAPVGSGPTAKPQAANGAAPKSLGILDDIADETNRKRQESES